MEHHYRYSPRPPNQPKRSMVCFINFVASTYTYILQQQKRTVYGLDYGEGKILYGMVLMKKLLIVDQGLNFI